MKKIVLALFFLAYIEPVSAGTIDMYFITPELPVVVRPNDPKDIFIHDTT